MIRVSIPLLLASFSFVAILPEVKSYAKVSINGHEDTRTDTQTENDPTPWIVSNDTQSESRSIKNIAITVSPVYSSPRITNLKNGEAFNYSPAGRYTTLDQEMLSRINTKKQIQDRYHPGALSHFKKKEPPGQVQDSSKSVVRPSNPPTGPSSSSESFDFSNPSFPQTYEYKPPDYLSTKPILKPDYLSDKPISKPLSMEDYSETEISDKPPDSYLPAHEDQDFTDYSADTSYGSKKPMEYQIHMDHPSFENHGDDQEDSYDHSHRHHHDFHHEVIYDHIPDYHDHTEPPETNDQRLDKRPYSYYFIGKKLWYLPLYFSIYFVIYIAALVLKSIARHKITFPSHLAEAVGHSRSYNDLSWWDYTGNILQSIESFAEKYGNFS